MVFLRGEYRDLSTSGDRYSPGPAVGGFAKSFMNSETHYARITGKNRLGITFFTNVTTPR